MVSNSEVAASLGEVADLLDLLGERFKPEAYRRAGRSIEALPESLEAISSRGELRSIPGVGEAIAEKVLELLRTGALAYLERLRGQVPAGVRELMRLPGVGPKTARRFWTELGIEGPAELARAIDAGRLTGVKGFAERKIDLLRSAVGTAGSAPGSARVPIERAWPLARSILKALRAVPSVHEISTAGSLRRARETVGDLDVLVTADDPEAVFDAFSRLPEVAEVRLRGPTKETVVLAGGLQVDLRVVEPAAFGAALQYFTGSKDHNVRLRSLARERGLKVNEYGVYRGEERLASRTEPEVYAALGLAWIPPELREDRGEIDAAATGTLPQLVEAPDLTFEPHVHLSEHPEPSEIDRLVESARRRRLRTVGVVVGVLRGTSRPWTAPGEVVERLRRPLPRGPELVPVLEVEEDGAAREGVDLRALGARYLVLIPPRDGTYPTRRRTPSLPVRLLAHIGGTAESAPPVLELARVLGAALEIGPGTDRFDSTAARLARESKIPLGIPTGVGRDDEDPTAEVALGFARRAGATREDVLNARDPVGGPVRRSPAGRARSRSPVLRKR